jgi:hypothetical protein
MNNIRFSFPQFAGLIPIRQGGLVNDLRHFYLRLDGLNTGSHGNELQIRAGYGRPERPEAIL